MCQCLEKVYGGALIIGEQDNDFGRWAPEGLAVLLRAQDFGPRNRKGLGRVNRISSLLSRLSSLTFDHILVELEGGGIINGRTYRFNRRLWEENI